MHILGCCVWITGTQLGACCKNETIQSKFKGRFKDTHDGINVTEEIRLTIWMS